MSASILLIVLAALAVLVAAYVLWPLLGRSGVAPGADAAPVAMAVLRERRRELEASLAHLPPDAPERRAALAEFAAQTEAELPAGIDGAAVTRAARPPDGARRPWTALALAVVLVVPAAVLYLRVGVPDAASPDFMAREPATLDELVLDLRKRLARSPDDLDGWQLLGRAELARGRPAEARDALERALGLAPADAQIKVDLADAAAQAQGSDLSGRPIALIREALATDPRNAKGLALAGAYEVTQRNFPAAIGHWRSLLEVLPAGSEQARQVTGFVADLQAGRLPQPAGAAPAPQQERAAPAPSAAPSAAPPGANGASAGAPDASPTALRGTVALERSIAPRLRPDDTLFVVVRTLDDAGRPSGPPVAVLRARGADLPLSFTLDDRHAMSPAARLSSVPSGTQVVVVARLSQRGEATARSGDLQGASAPVRPGASDLRVLIDTVID